MTNDDTNKILDKDLKNATLKVIKELKKDAYWFHNITVTVSADNKTVTIERVVSNWFGGFIIGSIIVILILAGVLIYLSANNPDIAKHLVDATVKVVSSVRSQQ